MTKNWIYQARPDQYDIREHLRVGEEVPWRATRFAKDMRDGDGVFFWLAGTPDIRGVYARGHVTGPVYKDEQGAPRIPVKVDAILDDHVTVKTISESPTLKNLDILRIPIGTNFKLKDTEAEGIKLLFSSKQIKT